MPYKLHRRLGLWRKLCSEGVRVPPSDTAFSRSFVSNFDVCSPVTASGARGVPSASAHIQWCRSCLWMSLQQLIQSLFSQEKLCSCDIWPRPWSAWGWRQQCRHQKVDFGCLHLQPLPKFPVIFWPPPGVIWRHSCPQAPDCLCGFPLLSFFFFFQIPNFFWLKSKLLQLFVGLTFSVADWQAGSRSCWCVLSACVFYWQLRAKMAERLIWTQL